MLILYGDLHGVPLRVRNKKTVEAHEFAKLQGKPSRSHLPEWSRPVFFCDVKGMLIILKKRTKKKGKTVAGTF